MFIRATTGRSIAQNQQPAPEVVLPVGKVRGWSESVSAPAKKVAHELWWIMFEARVVQKNGPDDISEVILAKDRREIHGFHGGLRW